MKRGKIGSWMVKTGEVVEIGQVLAEIETDKAIMEFESTDEGILGAILFPEGSEVEVGTQIAWLLESQDELTPDQIDNDKVQLSTNTVDLQNNDKVNTETEGNRVF
jgi:pyruvate dehydrogenase E1 component beta subunit